MHGACVSLCTVRLFIMPLLQPNTHLVLSELYQKKLLTLEDVSMMRQNECTPHDVVFVQCTKPPKVVAATADVMNTLKCTEEVTKLRGLRCTNRHR